MQITFISLIVIVVALSTSFVLHTQLPTLNGVLKFFILPLAVAYGVLIVLNNILPGLNTLGLKTMNYIEDKSISSLGSMGYIEIFPPLLGVLLVFMLLAYSGMAMGKRPIN